MIFIVGNEGFNQGVYFYFFVCIDVLEKDVIVNIIFCGDCNQGIEFQWKDGVMWIGGYYNCINQNEVIIYIEMFYDVCLQQFNDFFNQIYFFFG